MSLSLRPLLVLSAFALPACAELRSIPPAVPAPACTGCHGDGTGPAPADPLHAAHLAGSERHAPVPCEACHTVPAALASPGHVDSPLPVEVVFSGRAVAAGQPSPRWDPETRSCAHVGCHGAGLEGGAHKTPTWTTADGTQRTCGSCHGDPPGGGHPSSTACATCHGEGPHGDGVVDLAFPTTCSACHGDSASPAPLDLVHRSHVLGTGDARPVACATCHVVPATAGAPGHLDAAPAEVLVAGWATGTCAGTACHSGKGGTLGAPAWADTSGQWLECGSCHGEPPPPPHPQAGTCAHCHGEVVSAAGFVDPLRHVDGIQDVSVPTACGACHGSAAGPAPADAGHAVHLGSDLAQIACTSCHLVPETVLAPGHVDTPAPAEVTFGGVALAGGAAPLWTSGSCAGTACHGPASPAWADAVAPGAACTSCHGAPPAGGHPRSDRCDVCHAQVVGPGAAILDKSLHVSGSVEVVAAPACNACHGTAGSPAPPSGAHGPHVAAGVACAECHVVPAHAHAPGHVDTDPPAEVSFGPLATAGGAPAAWNAATRTCSGVACHGGALKSPGSVPSPSWDAVDGAAKACGACHGVPPPPPHLPVLDCQICHTDTPETHGDGTVDF